MFTKIERLFKRVFGLICDHLWRQIFVANIYVKSLFDNIHVDWGYIVDTLMEPLFWFVDNFTKTLGPIFVATVIALLVAYVMIAYAIGLTYWWARSCVITAIALTIGHWLLINVVWNYYMALVVSPGYPPHGANIAEAVSICKKCISPKPARTHHCSVCNRCILKMDHHCPWLNNCIGHYNHRYFYMFCLYTWFGTIFVILFGLSIAIDHFWPNYQLNNLSQSENHITKQNNTHHNTDSQSLPFFKNKCIVFEAIVTVGIFFSIGALLMWHSLLITRAETSIERHINKKEADKFAKIGQKYKNPYDFGSKRNWIMFFGFKTKISWIRILLPSNHSPIGDGLVWQKAKNFCYDH